MHVRERGTRGRALRTSTRYPEKPVVQPRGFGTRWLSPLEPYPSGGPGKHSRHFQIRLRHCYRRSGNAAESSSPEAPAHPPMQRSTSGRREEHQGYCWYAPFRGPSTFHWQLNWLRSARGAMVPWGFATTVVLRPAVLPPEVDLACLQPGRELDRDGGNFFFFFFLAPPLCWGNGAWPQLRDEHPQWEDDSSTNATSACCPRHVRQRTWPFTQRQATTASRNARVTRCLKQNPTRLYKDATSSLPDATSSLKRRTRECSFREKTLLACWSKQGRWSFATQTGGSAAWCVQSTRHGKNHHRCSAVPPARESSEERAQLVEFTRSAEVRSRTM